MSFLNAEEPNACDMVTDFGIYVLWHPSLGLELGDHVKSMLDDIIAGRPAAAARGSPLADPTDPVETGHVARPYDSCLVCTVHTFDGKTGRELAKFRLGEMG